MPDLWMDVDANLAEVPVNIMPLLDDTDFKSREESVAYNAAGLELIWHFTTTAGATTATVVTPTTGGAYDWAHQDGGMYTIEIPASGGASINNDTEGFGWFSGKATGVLPWRGPVIGFRAAGLNNALIDSAYSTTRGLAGTALPDAAADAAGGLPISDAGGLDLDAQIGTDIDAILVDTGTTLDTLIKDIPTVAEFEARTLVAADYTVVSDLGTVQTGDAYARLGAPAGASVSADIAAVKAQTAAIEADTQDLQTQIGVAGAGLTAVPWNAAWDAEVATAVRTELATELAEISDTNDVVNHADYGNAKLVRSTTPANTLTVDASHQALADVNAVSGDSTAADRLEAILDAMPGGTVVDDNDPDPTATAFETNLTEATNDHYNGAFVVFTSGALLGQSRKISDYDGTSKVLTVAAAFTEAPTAGDTFLILGRSE